MMKFLDGIEIPFDRVKSARVRRLDDYWRSKLRAAGGGGDDAILPHRDDIDAAEIKPLLPFLVIVDIEPDPFRVRYRLCGSMVSYFDEELTGKYLEDLRNTSPEEIHLIRQLYRAVVLERRPVYAQISGRSRQTGNQISILGAIWPLSSDGHRVDKCMAIEDFPEID
jgi:hypothetical protein